MIQQYASGAVTPHVEWIQAVGEVTGFRPSWIAFGDGEMRYAPEEDEVRARADNFFDDVLPGYEALNHSERQQLIDLAVEIQATVASKDGEAADLVSSVLLAPLVLLGGHRMDETPAGEQALRRYYRDAFLSLRGLWDEMSNGALDATLPPDREQLGALISMRAEIRWCERAMDLVLSRHEQFAPERLQGSRGPWRPARAASWLADLMGKRAALDEWARAADAAAYEGSTLRLNRDPNDEQQGDVTVTFSGGKWTCECDDYKARGTCAHSDRAAAYPLHVAGMVPSREPSSSAPPTPPNTLGALLSMDPSRFETVRSALAAAAEVTAGAPPEERALLRAIIDMYSGEDDEDGGATEDTTAPRNRVRRNV
jgi:hypothetical protein